MHCPNNLTVRAFLTAIKLSSLYPTCCIVLMVCHENGSRVWRRHGDMETLSEFNVLLLKISLFLLEHMVYVVQEMKLIIRF